MDLVRAVLVSLVAGEILVNVQKHAFVDQEFGNVIITVVDEPEKNSSILKSEMMVSVFQKIWTLKRLILLVLV